MGNNSDHSLQKGRYYVLGAICLAALVLPLSFTGGAVATPTISKVFNASPSAQAWVTNAFMLSFGSLLMAAGTLSDIYGRKRIFTHGLLLFIIVSLLLANATSIVWLDILRAVQGIAAAAALASGSAALAQEFEGHDRTRAFSLLGTTFGLGLAFGPMITGALIEQFGWRSIFFTTAIFAATALIAAVSQMHESKNPQAQKLDLPGLASFSAMLVLFTTGIILAPQAGWGSSLIVSLLISALTCLIAFVVIELRSKEPMLELSLLRHTRFIGVQLLPLGTCYCYIVLIVLLPFRLIGVEGISPIQSGLVMLALSTPMLVVPLLAAWLTRWISAGSLSGFGFLLAATGLYILSRVPIGDHLQLIFAMLIIGIGAGFPWGLMDGLAVNVVPKEQAGMAAGIFNTTRVAGEGIALAISIAMLTTLVNSSLLRLQPQNDNSELVQRLIMGNMSLSQNLDHAQVLTAYQEGFSTLMLILSLFTIISSCAAFFLLSRKARL